MRDISPATLMAVWGACILLGTLAAGIIANTVLEARAALQRGDYANGR